MALRATAALLRGHASSPVAESREEAGGEGRDARLRCTLAGEQRERRQPSSDARYA